MQYLFSLVNENEMQCLMVYAVFLDVRIHANETGKWPKITLPDEDERGQHQSRGLD
jgi:hypothetical protein